MHQLLIKGGMNITSNALAPIIIDTLGYSWTPKLLHKYIS